MFLTAGPGQKRGHKISESWNLSNKSPFNYQPSESLKGENHD
jgi:hypothetical protein